MRTVQFWDSGEMRRKMGDAPWRRYVLRYIEDSPGRAEAVAFFRRGKSRLHQEDPVPMEVDLLSEIEGQKYLDEHPMPREWGLLVLGNRDGCTDADLERLRYLPELRIITIRSDEISDAGVAHLKYLRAPEVLHLYSRAVTDRCLEDIAQLKSLKSLDLQGSPQVSRDAFGALVRRLPSLVDVYPPWRNE